MRKRFIAMLATFMMVLGLAATATPAQAVFYTPTYNHYLSAHRVQVANGLAGLGTREYVNPGATSRRGTNSIYVSYTCATSKWQTMIGGTVHTSRGWKNVGHHAFTKRVLITPCKLTL